MREFRIEKIDEGLRKEIWRKIDNLNKPLRALGRLETLAEQICLVQHTLSPSLKTPCHLLFGADHGIEREGVSVSPREVTWQQMKNFARGGGGVNMFCRQHGFRLRIIDVGVDYNLEDEKDIINRKIARGTKNFLYEPAMNEEEFERTINVGVEMIGACKADGCNIVSIGEMGIANTSPSSIWMHLFGNIPLDECIGAGSGLNSEGMRHKYDVLRRSVDNYKKNYEDANAQTLSAIRYFGGFEMVAAIGAMLRAAELRMIVLVDGFIMTACALAANRLAAERGMSLSPYLVYCHCGDEKGHRMMLNLLDADPLLSLGLRLGEGTGALCAYPIVDSAVRMVNEMNNFDNANITRYF